MSGPVPARGTLVQPADSHFPTVDSRPHVSGKFLSTEQGKLYVHGVTYGTFQPNEDGELFPPATVAEADFRLMAASGINAVRTYTVPPACLLDLAGQHGLRVMVGVPWEQHITFLDDAARARAIRQRVGREVKSCAGHPAVLCYAVGNEIPASIVRWHGRERIEKFIRILYEQAKASDPEALVTYVNYPTTEYLQLPFLDLVCFNIYLESKQQSQAYIARLQNLTGDRPLVLTEIGLDSRRKGLGTQASALNWQIRTAFEGGCAGVFVFSWTDQWYRGGFNIKDWDFGLTTRNRRPKPALTSVSAAFNDNPFAKRRVWPRASVVVCTCNGSSTIRKCCANLRRLRYPNYEIIVVDDGSTDGAGDIALEYGFRVINTPRRGLSSARNTGWEAATGEIIAYTDDDAYPDPDWLTFLVAHLRSTDHAAVGGPNIPPPTDDVVSTCIQHAPGGPIHVLLSDTTAEHIPGCNMAFWKSVLKEIGGFDPQFTAAGDDVDVCWRLQDRGYSIGFSPGAMVWHLRRSSLTRYWRQQKGYGKAEALLERKWPARYNGLGHVHWSGRVYGNGKSAVLGSQRVYGGIWGTALFQSLYEPGSSVAEAILAMPEWYLLLTSLILISLSGLIWKPLLWATPVFLVALAAQFALIVSQVRFCHFHTSTDSFRKFKIFGITVLLYFMQPLARLLGRAQNGLTPWRRRGGSGFAFPIAHSFQLWSEQCKEAVHWMKSVESQLQAEGVVARRGGDYDDWDLHVCGGLFGGARVRMVIEVYGAGKQLVRFRCWPRWPFAVFLFVAFWVCLAVVAGVEGAWISSVVYGGMATFFGAISCVHAGRASNAVAVAVRRLVSPHNVVMPPILLQQHTRRRGGIRLSIRS